MEMLMDIFRVFLPTRKSVNALQLISCECDTGGKSEYLNFFRDIFFLWFLFNNMHRNVLENIIQIFISSSK